MAIKRSRSVKRPKPSVNAVIVEEGQRLCPICQEAMTTQKNAIVSIDVCEEHGCWFDKGEYEYLVRRLKSRHARQKNDAVKGAKRQGKIEGTALGVWSLLFD